MRRQFVPAVLSMVVFTLLLGVGYSLVVTGIAQLGFNDKANGSLVQHHGKDVGSRLLGQAFVDEKGNPIKKYFQSRPSAASGVDAKTNAGYDPTLSSGSNLGPSNPLLIGFVPGVNSVDLKGNSSKTNPFASPDDPYCVPTDKAGNGITSPTAGQKYAKNDDGSYVCEPNTVPQRTLAYRELNGLSSTVKVPVDAVTASASGLDPDISIANARLQAKRVARERGLSIARVRRLIDDQTSGRTLGVLGEKTVNVLELNIAFDQLTS
jgi:K+-transporting ATPase ATPase C chain